MVLATYLASRALPGRVPSRVALAIVLGAYVAVPAWRDYPSLFHRLAGMSTPGSGPSLSGVVLPESGGVDFARDYRLVAERLARLRAQGHTVGILDPCDTIYYLGSGCPPQERMSPMFQFLFRNDDLDRCLERFFGRRLDYIAAKPGPRDAFLYSEDIWERFASQLARDYEPAGRAGSFVIWRRRAGGRPEGRPADADAAGPGGPIGGPSPRRPAADQPRAASTTRRTVAKWMSTMSSMSAE